MKHYRYLSTLLSCLLLLQACANTAARKELESNSVAKEQQSKLPPAIPLQSRVAWPDTQNTIPQAAGEKLYKFAAKDLPLKQALKLFAQAYNLNLVVDDEVKGIISINFRDLAFGQAMSALLDSHGYYWQRDGNLVYVRSIETRVFTVDYIRLIRSGSGNSQAKVSSGSSDESGGDEDNTAGEIKIEQEDKVDFWDELEKQLAVLKSEQGRLVLNRLAGTIQITDQHRRVKEIGQFIDHLNRAIYRQVDIEVKILEVTLNDDFSLGIDWSRLVSPGQEGRNRDFNINNIIGQPVGGITALPSTLQLNSSEIENGANKLSSVVSALSEQGEIKIVSQPRIRTLNNQSALIKVGTDRTFFRKEQLTDSTTAGSQILSTDVPQVVTEGIVLAITPQISIDGWITMDISPVVTRVASVSEVIDDNGVVQSSAPNLDISQTSSLVRARSGETIIIGGLIQSQTIESERGVPLLKEIPGLGYFFRGKYKSDVQRELVMFVTPRLIGNIQFPIHNRNTVGQL